MHKHTKLNHQTFFFKSWRIQILSSSAAVPAVQIVKEKSGLRKAAVTSCRSPLRLLIMFKSERSDVSTQ